MQKVHRLELSKHHFDGTIRTSAPRKTQLLVTIVQSAEGGALIRTTLPNLQDIDFGRSRMRFSEEPLPGQTASFLRPSACSALNILNKMCVNKFKIFPNFSKVRGQMSLGPVHSCIANYINKHWSENLCRNNEQLHRAVLKTSARCTAPV